MNDEDGAHYPGPGLTDEQRIDWIRLSRSEGVGPRTFRALVNRFGGAAAAVEALPGLNAKAGREAKVCSRAEAEREWERTLRAGARLIASGDPDYPRLLNAIDAPPPLITVKGRIELMRQPTVAIVGSRNASAAGLRMTETLSRDLGRVGFVLVSGLARGIDTAAHRTTLGTGTIAVLAGGIDKPYPAENVALYEEIGRAGVVVTEMPLGWAPRGRDFPRRNRIISGLSFGVVVVEAAHKSGTLITARFAAEQGREVFAVPGSPLDPRADGTNALIREGATLVTEAAHVVEAVAPLLGREDFASDAREDVPEIPDEPLWDEFRFELDEERSVEPPAALRATGFTPLGASTEDRDEAGESEPPDDFIRLVELMGPAPVGVDELVRLSGLPPGTVQRILVELELAGRLERHGGRRVALAPTIS